MAVGVWQQEDNEEEQGLLALLAPGKGIPGLKEPYLDAQWGMCARRIYIFSYTDVAGNKGSQGKPGVSHCTQASFHHAGTSLIHPVKQNTY